jgi:RNA polymerase sigma-70 factor (ECF subfamily)
MPPAPEALLEHAAFVRSVARATLRGDDLVDDVVQDTMLAALEESHRRRGPLRAWLAGVARNKARNLIRQRATRRKREERAASDEATDGVDELVARAEEGRRLVAAVLALDVLYRKAILLRYYEGMPPREVARRLDIPVETARTRIKRGIDRLRADLERTHEQEPGGWRAALLPLLQLPAKGPVPTPVLITGGVVLGKNGILWAALLLLIVAGGLWLQPWADEANSRDGDQGATLTSGAVDPGQPRLRGLPSEADGPSTEWPAAIDFAQVDRDRDLHGWVVRADGSPVAGASVIALSYPWRTLGVLTSYGRMLASEKGPSSVSGVDGSFSLSLARGELVHLRVRAHGFAPTELTYLQAGERVRVVLAEAVGLIVDATDADGKPVVGMPVRFFVNPERTGHWLEIAATTGTDGRAVFADLPPSLKGWIDPAPHREGLGNPGWVGIELPASGEITHRLQLAAGKTLRGRVLHSGTGAPIEGARVSTNWALLPSVSTDAEGKYVLHGWTTELRSVLHATAPGFVQSAVELTESGIPDIRLTPGVTLRGRVVDEVGEVVAGALVSVACIGSGRRTPSMGSAVTDAEGHFVVDGLDWPAKILTVRSPGRGRLVQVIAQGAKEDLGDLTLPAPCEVTATLTDPAGAPMARIPVTLTPSENFDQALRRLERWTDDLGRVRFPDLGPAAYDLVVGPRFEPILRRRLELTAEQPTVDLLLTPDSVRSVVIHAVDTEGKPAVGVYVWANATQPPDRKQGKTGEGGEVTLELFRRPYRLSVMPTVGLGFALPAPIELDASQTSAGFTLERLVAIRGRLVTPDDKPIGWGSISVTGDGDEKQYVNSDEGGSFVAYVSGNARVSLAFQGTVQNTMERIHKFVPYTALVDDVVAGAEDVVMRTTALDMRRELTIRLVDPAGQPVSGAGLSVTVPVNEQKPAISGSDGRASWTGLPALPLTAMFSGWRGTSEQPWIAPRFESVTPEGQELTVRFRQGSVVEGTVLKDDGVSAPFAYVQILEDGKSVRGAIADADGRFVAILDPEWNGKVSLRCEATGPGGKPKFIAVEEVRLGQAPVTLQLKAQD